MTEDQLLIYWAAVSCGKIDPEAEDEFTEKYVDSLMDWWNPLYNNEDAFKLAIQMKIGITFNHNYCCATYKDGNLIPRRLEQFDPQGFLTEEQLARYSIVMAAAEIGENKYE